MLPLPVLAAPPFELLPFAPIHRPFYTALFSNPAVMSAVGPVFDPARAERAAEAALRHQQAPDGRFRHWLIVHAQGTAGLLGLALRGKSWPGGEAELGVLLWPAWQARGAATAAIRAVRAWAFEAIPLACLTCHHAEGHAGAEALMRRLGFFPSPAREGARLPRGWECRNPASLG